MEKLLNLGVAIVQHVAAGFPQATPEVQNARKAMCVVCPYFVAKDEHCAKCGCSSLKLWFAEQKCPLGKW